MKIISSVFEMRMEWGSSSNIISRPEVWGKASNKMKWRRLGLRRAVAGMRLLVNILNVDAQRKHSKCLLFAEKSEISCLRGVLFSKLFDPLMDRDRD